jgi:hypothetical protein
LAVWASIADELALESAGVPANLGPTAVRVAGAGWAIAGRPAAIASERTEAGPRDVALIGRRTVLVGAASSCATVLERLVTSILGVGALAGVASSTGVVGAE